jgi:hypothetical protein
LRHSRDRDAVEPISAENGGVLAHVPPPIGIGPQLLFELKVEPGQEVPDLLGEKAERPGLAESLPRWM